MILLFPRLHDPLIACTSMHMLLSLFHSSLSLRHDYLLDANQLPVHALLLYISN